MNEKKSQFYILFEKDENQVLIFKAFYSTNIHDGSTEKHKIPEDAILITDEQHQEYQKNINQDRLTLWYDGKNIKTRPYHSKWDGKKFIEDIDTKNKQELINNAKTMFHKYNYSPFEWHLLSKTQKDTTAKYLDTLKAIIDGKDDKSIELPEPPL